jgi:hypothetical protein
VNGDLDDGLDGTAGDTGSQDEGEYIVPQPGSEARISPPPADGTVINYYFPVQIEVVGSLSDTEVQRVANYVFDELDRELATRI